MEYLVTKNTGKQCQIELVPETDIEVKLLKMTEEADTFSYHYEKALEDKIDKNAALLLIVDEKHYPTIVTVKYQIAKGLGE